MRARQDNRIGLPSTLTYSAVVVVHPTDWRLPFGGGTGKPVQPVHAVKTDGLDSAKADSKGRPVLSTRCPVLSTTTCSVPPQQHPVVPSPLTHTPAAGKMAGVPSVVRPRHRARALAPVPGQPQARSHPA